MIFENIDVKKRKRKIFVYSIFFFIGIIFLTILLWYQGIIIPNASSAKHYPVKGVDVSSYQGEIEWAQIQEQDLKFAFIKATEGSTFVDKYFEKNWKSAENTTLRIGAYHFFSYDSEGKSQAQNFIKTVPISEQALPPVIDVEFYGDKGKNPPYRSQVEKELHTLVKMLEEHYGKRVILYTTRKAYDLYIKNSFEQCDIWIRDVFTKPSLPDKRKWTFWQYTDREQLYGYNGEEKYIDVNVFYGSEKEFIEYGN
ncbi:glycoside hydrolase family 25 protein [Cytobacillus dafuensis]|uniref:Glycoside hydrolase family 25 protein n=1 Tax=Cytobacillus dafuensis TaxID=1742359 RepID=A0A5B8Z950_CYTDA|nr:GH25 family lysozyme [Cytobacillus dafuensis]QED49484.1 glycoside hydrolase family 25 protein [Cytobacillus dafuensis]